MHIFHLGLNKCGSKSLNAALNYLKISSIHNYYNKKDLQNIVRENIILRKPLFNKLDKKYNGFIDFNGIDFLHLLEKQYPDSKYIFTIRPFDDWVKSRKLANIKYNEKKFVDNENKLLHLYKISFRKINDYFRQKPEKILIIKICEGEGWPELCNFLNLPQPNIPFPHLNSSFDKLD